MLSLLQFQSLQNIAGLQHAVTTRHGGISGEDFASLNLGYHVGDDAECVGENRRLLARELGYEAAHLVAAQQVHSAHSEVVDKSRRGRGAFDWNSAIEGTDALIVIEAQVPVLMLVADCAPLLIVDAENHVLAVVHAGWRGAVAGVASGVVRRMQQEFGSDAADLRVGIGPCLCVACLEIGPEVAEQAPDAVVDEWEKPHLDLRGLLRQDLAVAGVSSGQIEVMARCPKCESQTFFSHRGQSGSAGRCGLVAWWR